MPRKSVPRRGSRAFSPRVRAKKEVARIRTWPAVKDVRLLGFAGYKAGMTHGFIIDNNKQSPTVGQELFVPITVIEAPPLYVAGYRVYYKTPYGQKAATEVWTDKPPEAVKKYIKLKKTKDENIKKIEEMKDRIAEVRAITITQPVLASVPKKRPEMMEHGIGGEPAEQLKYAQDNLGKEIRVLDIFKSGEFVDVIAVTTGKGFQGPVKRWGVKMLVSKSEKARRKAGNLGAWTPSWVDWHVPQAGQMGYHKRTEFNKLILQVGDNPEEINPAGGFVRYGFIGSDYLLIKGSLPGPRKRLVRLRYAIRSKKPKIDAPELVRISKDSKQGA